MAENNPKANLDCFVDGWFRTGDQGFFDEDNFLIITGRLKEIINKDQSGEVFDRTPEKLAKAILNCIDEKRTQLYISNIIKPKNVIQLEKYLWRRWATRT